MTVAYLADRALELLDAAEDALVQATTGHAPPGHVFLVHGEPADDFPCDGGQLTVHISGLSHEQFGRFSTEPVPQSCARTPTPTFVITLRRCLPTPLGDGTAPSATAQDEHARNLMIDLWAILTELYDRARVCTLFTGVSHCSDINIGEVIALNDEGGVGGWQIPVSIVANDSGPEGS